MANSPLVPFVCPVCGRVREVTPARLERLERARFQGVCRDGSGCFTIEHGRRFWLRYAGVSEAEIRAAGGAARWVAAHGLPGELAGMAAALSGFGEFRTSSPLEQVAA